MPRRPLLASKAGTIQRLVIISESNQPDPQKVSSPTVQTLTSSVRMARARWSSGEEYRRPVVAGQAMPNFRMRLGVLPSAVVRRGAARPFGHGSPSPLRVAEHNHSFTFPEAFSRKSYC
ncbi:hypothetical protein TNCV_2308451 [Trichonephila clavipes]|nr:hypothetical protein TNCV_2308451 [Trichonephila clavipes]